LGFFAAVLGAEFGAEAGTAVFPGIGTVVGAVVGFLAVGAATWALSKALSSGSSSVDSSSTANTDEKTNCTLKQPCCNPPVGTECYEGPDTSHAHGGLNPHYHIYQMFYFGGACQWKYLGGKIGKGVLSIPDSEMLPCSSYPGFQGR
jgi:hypothetical protein